MMFSIKSSKYWMHLIFDPVTQLGEWLGSGFVFSWDNGWRSFSSPVKMSNYSNVVVRCVRMS